MPTKIHTFVGKTNDMANITLSLSSKVDRYTGTAEVLVRFTSGRRIALRGKSGIYIPPAMWDDATRRITTSRKMTSTDAREAINLQQLLDGLCAFLLRAFAEERPDEPTSAWLADHIAEYHDPDKFRVPDIALDEAFALYVNTAAVSAKTTAQFRVLGRMLARYQTYYRTPLKLADFTENTLTRFEAFIRHEHRLVGEPAHERAMLVVGETQEIKERGQNTVSGILRRLRTFFHWAADRDMILRNPFQKYKIPPALYGTPIYITIEERQRIERCNLRRHPHISVHRDVFVFQCLIGCRVGDLLNLTCDNVIDGAIEYVPHKTKEERTTTVRVPLTPTAVKIIERYADPKRRALLPFTSAQKYNEAIKRIFHAAGLTRLVTVINPTTREEEKRPLYEVASSHMARRTFIGNLYKKVKDPNLVGSLSGHKEGSKAFARYRNIDEEMKRELVSLLD